MAKHKLIDVAVIIPDASPIMTLARIDRLDLLDRISVPIHIVDQVHYEITKPANDPDGKIAKALRRLHNQIEIIPTVTGLGFRAMRESDPDYPSRDLGEQAVDEYARRISRLQSPPFIPLILFEDPDVLELAIGRMKGVHLINTKAWLISLGEEGLLPDSIQLIEKIDQLRSTSMVPFEKDTRTKKVRSVWLRRSFKNADE